METLVIADDSCGVLSSMLETDERLVDLMADVWI
jgi:hypothetical protein